MSNWYFSEDDDRLICPEQVIQLTPKAAAVLSCLTRHKGDIVTTDTFLDEVWPGIHVTPDLVREYIHDLRAALGDEARSPKFIETVRGKGFRLIGEIRSGATGSPTVKRLGEKETRPTVAVLRPVTSDDDNTRDIADAVASDIINRLAQFHYVGVVARQSSFSSNEVTDLRAFARDVQADYILESNIERFGEVLRTHMQLVDAKTGKNLWGTRLDLNATEKLAAVDEITTTVVLALTGWHGELHRAEFKTVTRKRNSKLNAFEHFILGCDLEMRLDAENLRHSLSHLEKSVELDPTFARAWLVYALELRWAYAVIPGRDRTFLAKSREAFETAFNLAPADPVNLALVAMNTARLGNLGGALTMLAQAEASMTGDSDAMVCVATAIAVLTDDIDKALGIFDTVVQSNHARPSWFNFSEAVIAFMAGQYARSISSSLSGPQEISALIFRCLSHAKLGQSAAALAAHRDLIATFPDVDFERFASNFPIKSPARRKSYDDAVKRLNKSINAVQEQPGRIA